MSGIVYPAYCRPIYYSLRADMVLERIQQLFDCLASTAHLQDPKKYLPLAYYLLKLEHSDEMINLLALCCVCEIFKALIVSSDPFSVVDSEAFTFFTLAIVEIQALALNNYDAAYKWRYYLLKSFCDCKLFALLPLEQHSFADAVFQKFLAALFLIGTKSENTELFTPTLDCLKELCENTLPLISPATVVKEILGPLTVRNRIIDLMVKKALNVFMRVHINEFCEIFQKKVFFDMNCTLFRVDEEYDIAEQVISITDNFEFIALLLQTITKGLANNYHKCHERLTNMMAVALIRYNKKYGDQMLTDEELAEKMRSFVAIFTKIMVREDFAVYSTILMNNGKRLLQSCPDDEYFRLKMCQIFYFVIKHERNRAIGQQLVSIFQETMGK